MSQPFVGEVRLVGFNYAPVGWNLCDGSSVSISLYSTLYNLIGTTYGGDGQQSFNLPDLRGRIPIHQGGAYVLGATGGVESVTLTTAQLPVHNHGYMASPNTGNVSTPAGNFLASGAKIYTKAVPDDATNASWLMPSGGTQSHNNLQPYQVLNWIIAFEGIYPSQ